VIRATGCWGSSCLILLKLYETFIQITWRIHVIENFPSNVADQLCPIHLSPQESDVQCTLVYCSVTFQLNVPDTALLSCQILLTCEISSELWVQSKHNQVLQGQNRRLKIYYVHCNLSESRQVSRHNDGLRTGRPGLDSQQRKNFLFFTGSTPRLRPTYPSIQWVLGALSLGLKRQWREADHSLTFSAEVKKSGAILPLLV
jgi:hypothetical protein